MKEYNVGDLVTYTSLAKEPIAKIREVREDCYVIEFMHGNTAKVSAKELQPIPLTDEVLAKNGWRKLFSCIDGSPWNFGLINLYPQDKGCGFTFLHSGCNKRNIRYVHEMQSLYWALGLNPTLEI